MDAPGRLSAVSAPRVPEGQAGTLLTISELAAFLAVKEQTVRTWCGRGLIPFGKLGRDLRFDREQVQEWLDERWTSGAAEDATAGTNPSAGSDADDASAS